MGWILGWILVAPPCGATAGTGPQDAAVRRALLIGISEYHSLPALQGAVNDVETIREILVRRWGFDPREVEVLRDEAASRAGILEALQSLAARAGPEDLVYVHYSGHGSQVMDLSGDEVDDGLDETWVPQDGRMPGVPDITDDELDAILERFRTPHVVVAIDACHSGTATRSASVKVRAVPLDTRLELYESQGARRSIIETSRRRVILSAARADQPALDGPIDGRHHGFFSYALARSLMRLDLTASARQLFESVVLELGRIQLGLGRYSMPEPQLESRPQAVDAPVLGAATPATPTLMQRLWLAVRTLRSSEVLLERGALLGAVAGSRWLIVGDGPPSGIPPGEPVVVTVVGQRGVDAVARADPGAPSPAPHARAMLLALPAPQPTVDFVGITADEQERFISVLQRDIRRAGVGGPSGLPMFIAEPADDGYLRILSGDAGEQLGVFDLGDPQAQARLQGLFVRSERTAALLALDSPADASWLAAGFAHHPTVHEQAGRLSASLATATLRIRRPDEARTRDNSLQLRIRLDRPAFLTIAAVDALGRIALLFPGPGQRDDFLPDGWVAQPGVVQVPDSLAAVNAAGFHWDVAPPAGTDTLRVFASTDRGTTQAIRQYVETLAQATATPTLQRGPDTRRSPPGVLSSGESLAAGAAMAPSWAAVTLSFRAIE
jgi:hypothetical protein